MLEEVNKNSTNGERPKARRWRLYAVVAIVATIVMVLAPRRSLPPVTQERLDQAKRLWESHGPADYDVEIKVQSRQSATYAVSVRNGEVQQASRDGAPLKQRRTWDTWSVPGMFGTIAVDVENAEKVASGRADASVPRVRIRGVFDSEFGYPVRFHRIESVPGNGNPEVYWEVTKFAPQDK